MIEKIKEIYTALFFVGGGNMPTVCDMHVKGEVHKPKVELYNANSYNSIAVTNTLDGQTKIVLNGLELECVQGFNYKKKVNDIDIISIDFPVSDICIRNDSEGVEDKEHD